MGKTTLKVNYSNSERTVFVKVPFDETIGTIISMLVNNYYLEGEELYSAQIKITSSIIAVDDFNKTLDSFGVTDEAILFISRDSTSKYKAPPSPPLITSPPHTPNPSETDKPGNSKMPQIKILGSTILGLKLNDIPPARLPNECEACHQRDWLIAHMNRLFEIKDERDNLAEELNNKRETKWISLIGAILLAVGGIVSEISNMTNLTSAIIMIFAIVLTVTGGIVSASGFSKDLSKHNAKGKKDNEQ